MQEMPLTLIKINHYKNNCKDNELRHQMIIRMIIRMNTRIDNEIDKRINYQMVYEMVNEILNCWDFWYKPSMTFLKKFTIIIRQRKRRKTLGTGYSKDKWKQKLTSQYNKTNTKSFITRITPIILFILFIFGILVEFK